MARNDELMPLPYGMEWRNDGFVCRSEPSGVTCRNALQHGFTVSRSIQQLFYVIFGSSEAVRFCAAPQGRRSERPPRTGNLQ